MLIEKCRTRTKPEEYIAEHIKRTVDVWVKLRERYQGIMETDNDFWYRSLLTVLFHDAGKISANFQEYLSTKDPKTNIRHEFISGLLLLFNEPEFYTRESSSLFALISHHKKLNDEIFSYETHKTLMVDPAYIRDFYRQMSNILKEIWDCEFKYHPEIPEYIANTGIRKLYNQFKERFYKMASGNLKAKDRCKYIYFKGILTVCDWVAAAHEHLSEGLSYSQDYLKQKIIDKLREEGKIAVPDKFSFRNFQIESRTRNNVIAIAPTGSGKTEAALIWASECDKFDKVLYLLPTRVTANAIHSRIKRYFPGERIGLCHSSAFLLQKELNDNYRYIDFLKEKTFFTPITVCTIDQILTIGFNLGFWEIKSFHLLNAKVIIDEIHIYSPYTLGLTIATILYLQENFNTTFYIMTATMPKKLLSLLKNALSPQKILILKDSQLLSQSNNCFETRTETIDELSGEILGAISTGKKILIVVNSVAEAVRLYEKYIEYSPICYHSKFINKDKGLKERLIFKKEDDKESHILIATQIVEVSLDINYDILFTENAPIDAIIQRAGRINRQGTKNETKVIVFPHRKVTQQYIYPQKDILEKTFNILNDNNGKRLSVRELVEMVDHVYQDVEIEKETGYLDGLKKYDEIQESADYIKDTRGDDKTYTREGLDSVDVIPMRFKKELFKAKPEEKAKHEVAVRTWQFQSRKKEKDADGFIFLDVEYTFEKGVNFSLKDSRDQG